MQLLYQAGQVGKTMARKSEGVYTDQGVLVPFSAVVFQPNYAADLEDSSSFAAAPTVVGSNTYFDAGAGPFGGGAVYCAPGASFPYQDSIQYARSFNQGLGGSNNFTIDTWIKVEAGRSYVGKGIVGIHTATPTASTSEFVVKSTGSTGTNLAVNLTVHTDAGSQTNVSTPSSVPFGSWQHLRICLRVSPSTGLREFRFFRNGVLFHGPVSTGNRNTYDTDEANPIVVGLLFRGTASDSRFPGWIGPTRIIKGYCLNNSNASFVPPTTYFPVY